MKDQKWRAFLSGEKSALKEIYDEHIDMLFAYGCQMVSRHDLVEDCIQDLFIYLWDKRESLAEVDSVKAYLLVSFKRNLIRKSKQEVRKVGHSSVDDSPFLLRLADNLEDDSGYSDETRRKLKQSLQSLTARQKEVLYLRFEVGMDFKAIASQLDMNYQSVRNLMHRAIKKLREELLAILLLNAALIKLFCNN